MSKVVPPCPAPAHAEPRRHRLAWSAGLLAALWLCALPQARASAVGSAAGLPAPDCRSPASLSTQVALNSCAFEDFTAAGAAQAAALQALEQGLSATDRQRLQRAQQAYTAYAAAQCDFESGAVAGGSAQPMVKWQCMARLTRARTETLRAAAQCTEGDLGCVRPQR